MNSKKQPINSLRKQGFPELYPMDHFILDGCIQIPEDVFPSATKIMNYDNIMEQNARESNPIITALKVQFLEELFDYTEKRSYDSPFRMHFKFDSKYNDTIRNVFIKFLKGKGYGVHNIESNIEIMVKVNIFQ